MDENATNWLVGITVSVTKILVVGMVIILSLFTLLLVTVTTSAGAEPAPIVITRDSPPDPEQYTWREVVSGLDLPLYVTHAGDGSGRLFALEQAGYVLLVEDGDINPQPFLDISLLLSDDVFQGGYTERGLLGLAFHPDYSENGWLFISHTDRQGHSVLARYTVSTSDPDHADPASRVELLTVQQPFADHNGGNIVFGPDGYLYMGLGDGGNPQLLNHNSQEPGMLLGKLLRLDVNADRYTIPETNPFVDNPDSAPEVWALGLRNPWRFSFDRATGDLYIADVGQWAWEELNFQPVHSMGGENYGWSAFEGTHPYEDFEETETLYSEMTDPIFEYPHQEGCSITGGHVYRGTALPDFQGVYIFGDYCTGFIRTTYRDPSGNWQTTLFEDSDFIISSFGEDEQGEIYLVDYKGAIYHLEAAKGRVTRAVVTPPNDVPQPQLVR